MFGTRRKNPRFAFSFTPEQHSLLMDAVNDFRNRCLAEGKPVDGRDGVNALFMTVVSKADFTLSELQRGLMITALKERREGILAEKQDTAEINALIRYVLHAHERGVQRAAR